MKKKTRVLKTKLKVVKSKKKIILIEQPECNSIGMRTLKNM
jgi:hypothetical protein